MNESSASRIARTGIIMLKTYIHCVAFALTLCLTSVSFAYEAIPFRNGGSIEGVIEYTGKHVPADPMVALTSETQYCGQSLPAQKFLIQNGKIENVVVFIDEIKAGKPIPDKPLVVTNVKCAFVPHIAVAVKGEKIIMKSDDPVLHTFDIHASLGGKELYHVSLHEKSARVEKNFSKTGLLELSCYVHPWQHAYIYIFDHPYAAITDTQGRFAITDIPPGVYTIKAWHEGLGMQKITDVKVESGKVSTMRLKYAGEKKND